MIFSDSHCHLDTFQPDTINHIISQARLKQVEIMVNMGMNLESSANIIRLIQSHREIQAAVGIHPWNAVAPTNNIQSELYKLAKSEYVVAIGEIGLDYVRNPGTREIQKELFQYELSLAQELGLPVNIHCKEAHQDMMDILKKEKFSGLTGIIHGFSGDLVTLHDWLDLGFYVSIGLRGFVTDTISTLQEIVTAIPLDRLLTETDSSIRGSLSGPLDVILVAEKLASVRQTKAEHIADIATSNLKHILKL